MRALVRARPDPGVRSIRRALPRRRRAVARPGDRRRACGDPAGSRRAPHHLAVALAAVALTATLAPATAAGAAACGSALAGPRVRRDVEARDDVRPDPRAAPARAPTPAQRPPSDARGDGPRGEHGARRRVLPRRRRPRPGPRGGLRRARRRRGARLGLRRRRLGAPRYALLARTARAHRAIVLGPGWRPRRRRRRRRARRRRAARPAGRGCSRWAAEPRAPAGRAQVRRASQEKPRMASTVPAAAQSASTSSATRCRRPRGR